MEYHLVLDGQINLCKMMPACILICFFVLFLSFHLRNIPMCFLRIINYICYPQIQCFLHYSWAVHVETWDIPFFVITQLIFLSLRLFCFLLMKWHAALLRCSKKIITRNLKFLLMCTLEICSNYLFLWDLNCRVALAV